MKVQLAIIGAVLVAGGILFLPETVSQFPAGTMILDALVADATNIKEYNQHTSQVGDTLYDVCLLYTSPSPRDKRQSRMPSSA